MVFLPYLLLLLFSCVSERYTRVELQRVLSQGSEVSVPSPFGIYLEDKLLR